MSGKRGDGWDCVVFTSGVQVPCGRHRGPNRANVFWWLTSAWIRYRFCQGIRRFARFQPGFASGQKNNPHSGSQVRRWSGCYRCRGVHTHPSAPHSCPSPDWCFLSLCEGVVSITAVVGPGFSTIADVTDRWFWAAAEAHARRRHGRPRRRSGPRERPASRGRLAACGSWLQAQPRRIRGFCADSIRW